MGFDPKVCTDTLTAGGFVPVCPAPHCEDFQQSAIYHATCGKANIYSPVQSLGCFNISTGEWRFAVPDEVLDMCDKLHEQDKNWKAKNCYCCCSCFARDTPVAVPGGEVPLCTLDIGNEVLAASLGGDGLVWGPVNVAFSQGTVGGSEPAMVYIACGADNRVLIASPDQPFMLADGTLIVAKKLAPSMSLMDRNGGAVPIKTVSVGEYTGGVHHIAATSTVFDGSINGHLILAGGVVAGDFVLQLHFPTAEGAPITPGHDQLPSIGTAEYEAHHKNVFKVGRTLAYGALQEVAEIQSTVFRPYELKSPGEIPPPAQSWVSQAQANDILTYGHQRPIYDRSGYASAVSAISLLKGFYPAFDYYVDWETIEPNVYTLEQFGRKFVILSGGLVRMDGFFFEGITMALAQAVSRWIGGPPSDSGGYSCVGEADLYAFGVISQAVWFGSAWLDQGIAAYDQVKALFKLIQPQHSGGNPHNVCGEPSIACRLKAMQSGLGGGSLPECAGGPSTALLQLQTAEGTADGVTLVFNLGVSKETAENPANYTITPASAIGPATRDANRDFVVTLAAALTPGQYRVQCANLVSIFGSKLDPAASGKDFTVASNKPRTK